jgi:hypothetical protein
MKRGAVAAGLSEEDQELKRQIRELDAEGASDMLESLCVKWHLDEHARGDNFEDQTMLMFQVFGLNYRSNMTEVLEADAGSFGLRELDKRIRDEELKAIGLYHRLHELGLLPEHARSGEGDDGTGGDDLDPGTSEADGDSDKAANLRRIVKVLEMVFYAKRVVLSAFQAKLAVHQLHLEHCNLDLATDLDTRLGSWALRFRYIENKMTPMQNLLLFLLDGAMEKRLRKSNGWMYEPVFINGMNTHAWKPVMEIKDFVYGMLHKETCWEQWCNATAAGLKNISSAIEYLTNCQDYQLPELYKQRGVYAFRNGVYMAREDAFHPFGTGQPLSDDVVACKFVDADFPASHAESDWADIPTPHLQSIMDYQEFEPSVCHWLYVMLGRLLYPLNELDSWQVIPFFKGAASSGKCVALGTPTLMYDGSVRAVETIEVGELLMGDDGTPRRVLALARGEDELFTLKPKKPGYPDLTVTREHVLCLKYTSQGSVSAWKYGKRVFYLDPTTKMPKAKKFTKNDELEAFRATIDRDQVFEMTVAEYMALPDYVKRYLVCYRVPVDFAVTEEPLFDPWTIGVWLGDGNSDRAVVTNGDADVCAAMEATMGPMAKRVASTNARGETSSMRYVCPDDMEAAVRQYGLRNNKHIPEALKTGSRETRMAVLAGLLDTDGWKNPAGYYEITQKRKVLADDIVFVARSLGFGATKTEVRKAAVKRALDGDPAADEDGKVRAWGTYWRVNIFGAGLEDIPLRCTRKRFAPGELTPRKDALKWGFDVVPAGRGPFYGFQTDGNERYLLGDFSVTHNSTIILKVCKMFYDAQDVGVLSNNIERKFGLSAFYDKYLFLAPEIKNDLGIEQAEFQSVVSGEDLQVNMKHKKAFATTWSVPGALAGNEVPAWCDNSGSVQRRVVLWEFGRAVTNGDMKLGEKLLIELPRILVKCNRAYLGMARVHSSVNVWTVLPHYFRKTRDAMAQAVNSVEAFLSSPEVVLGEDLYCPMDDFRGALKSFEIANNFKSKRYDADFFKGPFDKFGITIDRVKRQYRGSNKTRDYAFGVDLNNMDRDEDGLS